MPRELVWVAPLLAVALLASTAGIAGIAGTAGCAAGSQGGELMETVSLDEAATRVHDRAAAVAGQLGVPLENPALIPVPCEDPAGDASQTGVFYLSGSYQLFVGEGRMTEAIQTMQDYYAEQGFEVDEIRWSDDGAGRLRATDPDGFAYSARPIRPRVGYAFSVHAPCYQAPDGVDPTDGRWRPPSL